MIASEHLNTVLPCLSKEDSVQQALDWMEDYKVHHLPLVDGSFFLGLIPESALLEVYDYNTTLTTFPPIYTDVFIKPNSLIHDAIHYLSEYNISIVPVTTEEREYLGAITSDEVINSLSNISSFKNIGAVIILKMKEHDYSLEEISHIIESNGVKILSTHTQDNDETNYINVVIKLNQRSIDNVIASFERHSFSIEATFHRDLSYNNEQDKLDNLLNFLNI
ncbi:MAG: CBS domain-containing protein [Cytophagales bacterium]|nr:CBS domain-containing protein [Cytophagales bacterium]